MYLFSDVRLADERSDENVYSSISPFLNFYTHCTVTVGNTVTSAGFTIKLTKLQLRASRTAVLFSVFIIQNDNKNPSFFSN